MVTGPTGGVGEATAIALGAAGANVVLACRNVDKGARVAETIGPRASVHRLDLSELASVRKFACGLRDTHETIDVLINNAGVMAVPLKRTADGFEMQMGTNYFGHFALTGLVLDLVTDRVVTVSSAAHRLGRVDLDDPNWEQRRYHRAAAYAQSKLANLMFSFELARRLDASGSTVRSLAAHPGYAATEVGSHTGTWFDGLFGFGKTVLQRTAEEALRAVNPARGAAEAPGSAGHAGAFARCLPAGPESYARSRSRQHRPRTRGPPMNRWREFCSGLTWEGCSCSLRVAELRVASHLARSACPRRRPPDHPRAQECS